MWRDSIEWPDCCLQIGWESERRKGTLCGMRKVNFVGVIHPQSGRWYFDTPITVHRGTERIVIAVHSSVFNVEVAAPDDVPIDAKWANEVWNSAETWLRAALDALGYHLAASLEVQMLSGTVDDGTIIGNLTSLPALATVPTDRVEGETVGRYVRAAVRDPHVRHALADLRSAIQYPDDTAFYAYRSVESIRQCYLRDSAPDDGAARKASWESLRSALGVTHDELKELADAAKSRRHGGDGLLDTDKRMAFLALARRVVASYVDQLTDESGQPEAAV